MSKVNMSTKLPVSADMVWTTIGNFASISKWHPAIESAEESTDGGATIRTLTMPGGAGQVVEKLETHDDNARSYSYSIVSGPIPVSNYLAEIKVTPDGPMACTIEWTSDFEAAGVPENDAVKTIQEVYQAGFENLKRMFGAS